MTSKSIRKYLSSLAQRQNCSGASVGSFVQLRATGKTIWRTASETFETEKEGITKQVVTLGQNFTGDGCSTGAQWISLRALDVKSFHLWEGSPHAAGVKRLCSSQNRQHMTAASIYVLTSTQFVEFRLQTANLFFGLNGKSEPSVSDGSSGETGDHSESIVYAAVLEILRAYCDITVTFGATSGLRAIAARNLGVLPRPSRKSSLGITPSVFVALINKQAPCEACAKMWNELVGLLGSKVSTIWGSCQYIDRSTSTVVHTVKFKPT
jgi:hypothetical protein